MRKIFFWYLMLLTYHAVAAEASAIALAKTNINLHDLKSIQRGAAFFATQCMVCHTLIYLRYNNVARKAGVVYEKMPLHIKNWPNGVAPPDLSLEADVRGTDWIYTYLHSFYLDRTRPTGFNNLLVPNTAMPDILVPYQGPHVLANDVKKSRRIFGLAEGLQWYDLLEQQSAGTLAPDDFDAMVKDIVNFLAYAAEPYHEGQVSLGRWVIGFLLILFVLMYLLKREYWKDIKRK